MNARNDNQIILDENAQGNPFADLDDTDVEIALDQLTRVRDVYDRQVLRELAALLPYAVARDNKAILLERQSDGTFFVGMCNHQSFINLTNVARAMRVPATVLHPRVLLPQRFERLIEEVYDQTVAEPTYEVGDSQQETVDWNKF